MELPSPKKERFLKRKEVLEDIKRAASEEYETHWDETGRITTLKKKSNIRKGKKSKSQGNLFESKVRKDLSQKGWIVDKWTNNFDLDLKTIYPAKRKYNPFSKVMALGTGFPDFIAFQRLKRGFYNVIGVEVKSNGTLSLEEKKKCKEYLDKEIFNEIWVAKKRKVGRKITVEYINFEEIMKKMRS